MNPKLIPFVAMTAMAFMSFPQSTNGLKCNICFWSATSKVDPGPCELMSCDSTEDVLDAFSVNTRQQTGREAGGRVAKLKKLKTRIGGKHEYLCGKATFRKNGEIVASMTSCGMGNDKFPPAKEAHDLGEYLTATGGPNGKSGEIYFCDAKVGQGENCGENAAVDME